MCLLIGLSLLAAPLRAQTPLQSALPPSLEANTLAPLFAKASTQAEAFPQSTTPLLTVTFQPTNFFEVASPRPKLFSSLIPTDSDDRNPLGLRWLPPSYQLAVANSPSQRSDQTDPIQSESHGFVAAQQPQPDPATHPITKDSDVAKQAAAPTTAPHLDSQIQPASFQDQDVDQEKTQEAEAAVDDPSKLAVNEVIIDDLKQEIQDHIELVKSNATLDEITKQERLTELTNASALVLKAKAMVAYIEDETKKRDEFLKEKFQSELKSRQEKLAADPDPPETPPASQTSEQLQIELEDLRQKLQEKQNEQSRFETQIYDREKRLVELPGLRTKASQTLKKAKQDLAKLQSQPENLGKRLILAAREVAGQKELEKLDIESKRQLQRGVQLPIELASVEREIEKLEAEVTAWKTAYDAARKAEILMQNQTAETERKAAIEADPALGVLAKRNGILAEERTNLTTQMETCESGIQSATEDFQEIDSRLMEVRENIESLGSVTKETGIELVEFRNSIMRTVKILERIEQIKLETQANSQKLIDLKAENETLKSTDKKIEQLIKLRTESKSDPDDPTAQTNSDKDPQADPDKKPILDSDFRKMARSLLETQRDYVSKLNKDREKYRTCLNDEQAKLENLVQKVREAFLFIDENALWIRSANPFWTDELSKSKTALGSYFDLEKWAVVFEHAFKRVVDRPYESAMAGFILVGIFFASRRLKGSA